MKEAKKIAGLPAVLSLAVFLFITGCASSPKTTAPAPEKKTAPDWVLSTPQGNAQNEFFVGSSSDASGDAAKAEEQAVYSLIAEITRYMGVKITAETTAQAKASLNDFQSQITQQVKQSGSARVAGLRVSDKFVDKQGSRVTVYILAQYDRNELQKEKDRLAAVFQEQIDAVALPEQKGKDLEAKGDLYGAVRSYLEAAAAASGSNIDNAAIKFERNINNAKRVINRIGLVPLTGKVTGVVGEPLSETFKLKVVNGQTEKDAAVKGADILVSFKEARSGGRVGVKTTNLQSSENGSIEFTHPTPTFTGRETVTMMLDLSAFLAPLGKVPRNFASLVSGLEDAVNQKRVNFEYFIVSRAKDIATGIVVLDADSAGNPTGNTFTAAGILESLSGEGFKVRSLAYNTARLRNVSDAEIVKVLAAAFGGQIERVLFGVVTIDEYEEKRGSVQARASGTIKAADLKTGEILYTKRMFKRSVGSNAEGTISSAFRNLGLEFGKDIARNLQ